MNRQQFLALVISSPLAILFGGRKQENVFTSKRMRELQDAIENASNNPQYVNFIVVNGRFGARSLSEPTKYVRLPIALQEGVCDDRAYKT